MYEKYLMIISALEIGIVVKYTVLALSLVNVKSSARYFTF